MLECGPSCEPPVDAVPALDTAVWVAIFVVLQAITHVALHRAGALRMIFAGPAPILPCR